MPQAIAGLGDVLASEPDSFMNLRPSPHCYVTKTPLADKRERALNEDEIIIILSCEKGLHIEIGTWLYCPLHYRLGTV